MTELKPCPFCGGEAHVIPQVDGISGTVKYSAYCDSRCGVVAFYCDTEAEAIAAWNTRAERTCTNIETHTPEDYFVCSACGYEGSYELWIPSYCPNCGAKVVNE